MLPRDIKQYLLEHNDVNDLIFGYCRRIEHECNLNIPELITYILAAFYATYEEWDVDLKYKDVEISHNGTCVRSVNTTNGDWRSIFGKRICKEKGVYSWKIKYVKADGSVSHGYNYWKTVIGIAQNHEQLAKLTPDCFIEDQLMDNYVSYGFIGNCSQLVVMVGHKENTRDYGEGLNKEGDTVEVHLDLNENTLSYTINGTDYGEAYKVKSTPTGYRLAVAIVDGFTLQLCT